MTQSVPGPATISSCQPRVIAAAPNKPTKPRILQLTFPEIIGERSLWKDVGAAAARTEVSVCPLDGDDAEPAKDCHAGDRAVSVIPNRADDLHTILREAEPFMSSVPKGLPDRLLARAVLGNQWAGNALCEIGDKGVLGRCVVLIQTAMSWAKFLAGDQFFAISSPEVQTQSFQLADARELRMLSVTPSPGENLTDAAVSPSGSLLATLTPSGEVWLYRIDRRAGVAILVQRYDLRSLITASARIEATQTDGNNQRRAQRDGETFNALVFIDEARLAVTGANGGTLLAQIPSGEITWARPPIALLGTARQQATMNASADLLAIYDDKSAQLLSLGSGAPLSQMIDFGTLVTTKGDGLAAEASVAISDDGRVQISYGGRVYGLSDAANAEQPTWSMVPQITGIAKNGAQAPLELFLPRDH
jgi:hypothetical protein